jgi:hypothetical protein
MMIKGNCEHLNIYSRNNTDNITLRRFSVTAVAVEKQ